MDFERERGITIKSHAIQMEYYKGEEYILNLIDTGHVDFHTKFSIYCGLKERFDCRCSKSIQAQTISNLYLALENDLEIIPILIKWIYQVRTRKK
jgi:GTP-binding protein LepA